MEAIDIESEDLLYLIINANVSECDEISSEIRILPSVCNIFEDKQNGSNTCSKNDQNNGTEPSALLFKEMKRNEAESISKGHNDKPNTDEYPKRIRKSKYDYISGDLSHIRRDPKCTKRKVEMTKTIYQRETKYRRSDLILETGSSKMKEDLSAEHKDSNSSPKSNDTEDDKDDVLVVREVMKYLYHPKTTEHQNFALAVLSSDPNLMRIFLKEKKEMKNQIIPVIRKK